MQRRKIEQTKPNPIPFSPKKKKPKSNSKLKIEK